MRHGKKINHLSRTSSHRKAMLSNMACSLIVHKRINTTVAKAKALRKYVEPLLTKSKDDSTHSRRVVFGYLNDKTVVSELFRDVAPKVADRPGGYTRIIKTGNRLGDNAEMCMMELVDFNDIYTKEAKEQKTGAKRRRRGGAKKSTSEDTQSTTEAKSTAEKKPATKTETPKAETAKKETSVKAESTPEAKKNAEAKSEAIKDEPKSDNKDQNDSGNKDSDKA